MCAEAPDTRIAQEAALRNADISKEALDWYKQVYTDSAPDRAAASQVAREQSTIQRDLSQEALASVRDERDRYKTTFQPIEDRIANDAITFNTPARREAAARAAVADSEIALNVERQGSQQALERRGVTAGSGKSLALQGAMDLGAAKIKAGAANSARDRIEAVGSAKLMDAAGLGRGVVQNTATQAQIGLNSGNSSVGNASVPLGVQQQGAQLMGHGFSTAMQGNSSAANINMGVANQQAGVDSANGQQAAAGASAAASIAIAI
ncbi:MAG: hypothetical protein JWQ03_594 [Variovorax sp.]|nr:hypothetical protein [Variovorax sp.]